jgi:hypothetical protein
MFHIGIGKEYLLPPITASESVTVSEPIAVFETIPVSEPIPAFKLISPSENIPVATLTTTEETESAQRWEFQGRNLPEDEQNFWMFLAILFPSLINILYYLMEYRIRRGWYREKKTKERSQLRMMLEKGESFMVELSSTVAFMKELEDKLRAEYQNQTNLKKADYQRRAQLQKDMDSVRAMMKMDDKHRAQLQNEMDAMKPMMKVEDELRAQFQNEMDTIMEEIMAEGKDVEFENEVGLVKEMMKVEDERVAQFQNTIDSVSKAMEVDAERRLQLQHDMCSMKKMMELDYGRRAEFRNELESMKKTMEVEYERLDEFQNKKCQSVELSDPSNMQDRMGNPSEVPVLTNTEPLNLQRHNREGTVKLNWKPSQIPVLVKSKEIKATGGSPGKK